MYIIAAATVRKGIFGWRANLKRPAWEETVAYFRPHYEGTRIHGSFDRKIRSHFLCPELCPRAAFYSKDHCSARKHAHYYARDRIATLFPDEWAGPRGKRCLLWTGPRR